MLPIREIELPMVGFVACPFPGEELRRAKIIICGLSLPPRGVIRVCIEDDQVEPVRGQLLKKRVNRFQIGIVCVQGPELITLVTNR
jgi:hypothetical protein